jgi:FlaA1/EpsC-like NDP-sugar epimerase
MQPEPERRKISKDSETKQKPPPNATMIKEALPSSRIFLLVLSTAFITHTMSAMFPSSMIMNIFCLLLVLIPSSAFISKASFLSTQAIDPIPSKSQLDATKVGFIGFGTIASAIATGLATQTDIEVASISVTRRSEKKSKALAESFPSLVSVIDDNQKILDQADLIFLCVLPQQTSQVLQDLNFDESRHTLVSLAVS